VGDIISSPMFATGVASVDNPVVLVGPPRGASLKMQVDRTDATRAHARFLVEDAFWWTPKRGIRELPRAWRVRARRLDPDNSYNPDAERIVFHQKPEAKHAFVVERVAIHGRYELFKMEGSVIIVDGEHVSRIRELRAAAAKEST
jgi:hypothetical protein